MRLTDKERAALSTVLAQHMDGIAEARREIEEDPATFTSVEDYLEVIGDVYQDEQLIQEIRKKVNHDNHKRVRTSRAVRSLLSRVRTYAKRGATSNS